ncbi:MAG: chorismate synthase [bacterium]
MLRYLNAGESHGPRLTAVLEGLPSGLDIDVEALNRELGRRQQGYGRGGRMKIERDRCEITAGVRFGQTLGSPVCLNITNRDWENWQEKMSVTPKERNDSQRVVRPRPGHADLPGALKYNHRDIRNILERSSARETAIRVAVGAVCRQFLSHFGITINSHVIMIGGIWGRGYTERDRLVSPEDFWARAEKSKVRCVDEEASKAMVARIDRAIADKDSVGGVFEVIVQGIIPGLGSHVHWDRKLDGLLAGSFMSIQAVKGVEIGLGFGYGILSGSQVHDEIFCEDGAFSHHTNNAGGIEGGMSNGEDLVIRAVMKPIPTLRKPLHSVDIDTRQPEEAAYERSDVCAAPAAAVIGEAVAAYTIAQVLLEKFGGDSLRETKRNFDAYRKQIKEF